MFENQNQKKDKIRKKRIFDINLHLTDCLDIEFTAYKGELMTEKALTSFAVSDAYH